MAGGGAPSLYFGQKKKKKSAFLSFSLGFLFLFLFLMSDIGFVRKKSMYHARLGKTGFGYCCSSFWKLPLGLLGFNWAMVVFTGECCNNERGQ